MQQVTMHFDGATYVPGLDRKRLTTQLQRVRHCLMGIDGWWTLEQLQNACGGSTASISARIRDMRKDRFGKYTIDRRRVSGGLFEYRLDRSKLPNKTVVPDQETR